MMLFLVVIIEFNICICQHIFSLQLLPFVLSNLLFLQLLLFYNPSFFSFCLFLKFLFLLMFLKVFFLFFRLVLLQLMLLFLEILVFLPFGSKLSFHVGLFLHSLHLQHHHFLLDFVFSILFELLKNFKTLSCLTQISPLFLLAV